MTFMSSTFPSCFRPSKTSDHHPPPSHPNLTTYIYQTNAGTISLTWSRSILSHTLQIHLHNNSFSFNLHIKPFHFFNKNGSKKLSHNTLLLWNLSKARFGSKSSEPEPNSKFYIALVVENELVLFVNNNMEHARVNKFLRAHDETKIPQILVLKKEHVDMDINRNGTSSYATKTRFGGKVREIEIEVDCDCDCDDDDDNDGNNTRLLFSVDGERVLEVRKLKWKFRGNERVEIDGVCVLICWDVHDWVFENGGDGHAVFMFKFEENEVRGCCGELERSVLGFSKSWSSSSLSMSSNSVGGSSSVMEWCNLEESELVVPLGFTLIVGAWRR